MEFSERTQAFLVAAYYEAMVRHFGARGKEAFLFSVRRYGMQRGSRMAQRAIRDGKPLTYFNYCNYGEWAPSAESIADDTVNLQEVRSYAPDYEFHVTRCPWSRQFRDMGAQEAAAVYCANLDEAIVRGFNPDIDFRTLQNLQSADRCIFRIRNAGLWEGVTFQKRTEYVKPFSYHCAHVFYSFGESAKAIFGAEGKAVQEDVFEAFCREYGAEAGAALTEFSGTDFNVC